MGVMKAEEVAFCGSDLFSIALKVICLFQTKPGRHCPKIKGLLLHRIFETYFYNFFCTVQAAIMILLKNLILTVIHWKFIWKQSSKQ